LVSRAGAFDWLLQPDSHTKIANSNAEYGRTVAQFYHHPTTLDFTLTPLHLLAVLELGVLKGAIYVNAHIRFQTIVIPIVVRDVDDHSAF